LVGKKKKYFVKEWGLCYAIQGKERKAGKAHAGGLIAGFAYGEGDRIKTETPVLSLAILEGKNGRIPSSAPKGFFAPREGEKTREAGSPLAKEGPGAVPLTWADLYKTVCGEFSLKNGEHLSVPKGQVADPRPPRGPSKRGGKD